MEIDQLGYIPRGLSRPITAVLSAAAVVFTVIAVVFFIRGELEEAKFFADFAKYAYVGLGIWCFFLLRTRSLSTDELLRRTSDFLTREIPRSLRMVAVREATFGQRGDLQAETLVKVRTMHVTGATDCMYEVSFATSDSKYHLYIQLNVHRLVVIYFLNSMLAPTWEEVFKNTVTGARNAGWEVSPYGVKRSDWLSPDIAYLEVACMRTLKDNFLFDLSEQLFISNDIGAMTRSMVIEHDRLGTEVT